MDTKAANALSPAFLTTERLTLRALEPADASPRYLAWLNDPDVLRFRGPKAFPSNYESLKAFIASIPGRGDLVLAITLRDTGEHIGNVALNTILWVHRSAELSIMIGEKSCWGKGYGREIIRSVTKHAFGSMGLNRLWAESPNPGFNAAVKALGWKHEGTKRQALLVDGAFVDIECWGLLASEFNPTL